jgi:hypothetical protein
VSCQQNTGKNIWESLALGWQLPGVSNNERQKQERPDPGGGSLLNLSEWLSIEMTTQMF